MISAFTRREFTKLALTALPAAGMFSALNPLRAAAGGGKPNSRVAGVHIGLNVPYSFGGRTMAGDEILKNCRELNLSAVELRAQPVELFMGDAGDYGGGQDWLAEGGGGGRWEHGEDPRVAEVGDDGSRERFSPHV